MPCGSNSGWMIIIVPYMLLPRIAQIRRPSARPVRERRNQAGPWLGTAFGEAILDACSLAKKVRGRELGQMCVIPNLPF